MVSHTRNGIFVGVKPFIRTAVRVRCALSAKPAACAARVTDAPSASMLNAVRYRCQTRKSNTTMRYHEAVTTSQQVTGARPGGRSARVRAAIHTATLDQLAAHGYADLTIDAVADRAGVHRTTIYRRWPDKRSLVLAALHEHAFDQLPIPDTGDLRRDLSLLAQAMDHALDRPHVRALLATIIADRPGSTELADLRTQFWTDRQRHAQAIPQRAIQRGQLPPDTDPTAVIDMLAGPIYLRRFIQGQEMTATEIDELAARVVAAFTPRLSPGSVAPGQPG